jgi:serine/threonine-protein kinase
VPGAVVDRRYRLRALLGEGGMGAVWRAEHVRMGKAVALKLLRPEAALDRAAIARFQQEARIVSGLTHPNTVSVFDFGTDEDGALYLAMELVPGRDLAAVLEAEGALEERRAVSIAAQLLRSLAEAHEAGVVHRDVKPANVMLRRTREGEDFVKLVDFGIATMAEAAGGEAIGTPQYMSPEQLRGDALDARSDLYSVGVLLFELLTGKCPFDDDDPLEAASVRLSGPPPDPRLYAPQVQLSPGIEAVLARGLAADPGQRWASADEMRAGLAAAVSVPGDPRPVEPGGFEPLSLGPEGLEALRREEWDAFERRLRRRRRLAPLVAAVVLGAAGAGAWLALARPGGNERAAVSAEVEPNDGPETANLVAAGAPVRGFVQRRVREQADHDLFEFEVPGFEPQLARVTVSGVPNVNLALDLFVLDTATDGRLPILGHVDDLFLGRPETLTDVELAPGRYLVRVADRLRPDEPGGSPRENTLDPYELLIELSPLPRFAEREPNNALSEAMRLSPERPVLGHAGSRPEPTRLRTTDGEPARLAGQWSDDFFELSLGEGAVNGCLLLAGVPGARLGLSLVGTDLDRLRERADGQRALSEHLAATAARERPQPVGAGEIGRRCARARSSAAFKVEVLDGASEAEYRLVGLDDSPDGLAGVLELCAAEPGEPCQKLLAKSLQALPGAPWAGLARERLTGAR